MKRLCILLLVIFISCTKKGSESGSSPLPIKVEEYSKKITLKEDTSVNIDLLFQAQPKIIDPPAKGKLTNCQFQQQKYSCTYTPNSNYFGEDSFKVGSSNALFIVHIIVEAVNDRPMLDTKVLTFRGISGVLLDLIFPLAKDVDTEQGLLKYVFSGKYSEYIKDCSVESESYVCKFLGPPLIEGTLPMKLSVSDGQDRSDILNFSIILKKGVDSDGDGLPDLSEEASKKFLSEVPVLSVNARSPLKIQRGDQALELKTELKSSPYITSYYTELARRILFKTIPTALPYPNNLESIYMLHAANVSEGQLNLLGFRQRFKGFVDQFKLKAELSFELKRSEHYPVIKNVSFLFMKSTNGTLSNTWQHNKVTGEYRSDNLYPFVIEAGSLTYNNLKDLINYNDPLLVQVNDFYLKDSQQNYQNLMQTIAEKTALISIVGSEGVKHHYYVVGEGQKLEEVLMSLYPTEFVFADDTVYSFGTLVSTFNDELPEHELFKGDHGKWFLFNKQYPIRSFHKVRPGDKIAMVYVKGKDLYRADFNKVEKVANIQGRDQEEQDFFIGKVKTYHPFTIKLDLKQVEGKKEFFDENWMSFGYRETLEPDCVLSYRTNESYQIPYQLEEFNEEDLPHYLENMPLKQVIDGNAYGLNKYLKSYKLLSPREVLLSYDFSSIEDDQVTWSLRAFSELSTITQSLEGRKAEGGQEREGFCKNRFSRFEDSPVLFNGKYPVLYYPGYTPDGKMFSAYSFFLSNCTYDSGSCKGKRYCLPEKDEFKVCKLSDECPEGYDRFQNGSFFYCFNPKFKTKEVLVSRNYVFDVHYLK